jgi:predicted phage terminase large subunit-like protein
MGTFPDDSVIICSYESSFAAEWGAMARDTFYHTPDPTQPETIADLFNVIIDPHNKSASRWGFWDREGICRALGAGGPITGRGADCLPAGTLVLTEYGLCPIDTLSRLLYTPRVVSRGVDGQLKLCRIVATLSKTVEEDLYAVTTQQGRRIETTGTHPFYTTQGCVLAKNLQAGMSLVCLDVPSLQQEVRATAVRSRQASIEEGMQVAALLQGLQRDPSGANLHKTENVSYLRSGVNQKDTNPVRSLPHKCATHPEDSNELFMPGLWPHGQTEKPSDQNVLPEVCQQTTPPENALRRKLELPTWAGVPSNRRQIATADSETRRGSLRCLPHKTETFTSPHRPEHPQQSTHQLDYPLQLLPHHPSQITEDTVSLVERVSQGSITVYDIQVEETHSFFAEGILVGNCLIIDDPVKNQEAALSPVIRESIWNWFTSTALTRLSPHGSAIIVQCMTGDTPVLMADGTERLLQDIRIGHLVATYDGHGLSAANVLNWKNQGPDRTFTIRMSSGTTVKANERHPFLVEQDGSTKWVRLKNLRVGDIILRATGASGVGSCAPLTGATSLPNAKATACPTTTKPSGPVDTDQSPATPCPDEGHICGTVTVSTSMTTTPSLPPKAESVLSVESCQPPSAVYRHTGEANSASITIPKPERFGVCCATTVTSPLEAERLKKSCSGPLSTFEIVPDQVVEIAFAGYEDVFDIQVEGTENFIANGLVSHNTRWHRDDLGGRLLNRATTLDGEPVKHIHLPALPEAPGVDPIPDFLNRPEGEPLWPERWPLRSLQRIRQGQPLFWWNAMYQGRPTSADQMEWPDSYFDPDVIWCDALPDRGQFVKVILYIDPSKGKRDRAGDYSAIVIILIHENNLIYVDSSIERRPVSKIVTDTVRLCNYHKPDMVGCEGNAFQELIGPELERQTRNTFGLRWPIFMDFRTAKDNKLNFIRSLEPYLREREFRFLHHADNELLISQLRDFPIAPFDDGPDALAGAINLPLRVGGVEVPEVVDRYRQPAPY